jgi:GINS complex subunit 4
MVPLIYAGIHIQIDKHALHILTTPTVRARLSAPELQYLTQHHALQHAHFLASFLQNFPTQLQRLDDTAGGISMIDSPDLDAAVFVRVLRDVEEPLVIAGTDASAVLKSGDVWVVRYSVVSELVAEGHVELI